MQKDTYILNKTIEFPNTVVRVFSPVITKEEREKRIKTIQNAAANLMKGAINK